MAKLYFRYGAMGSSKTANTLMACYNYKEKGQTPVLLKPRQDTRDGERMIRSRIGLGEHCLFVDEFLAKVQDPQGTARKGLEAGKYAAVIVDEAQFLTAGEVDSLSDIVDSYGTPVLCYGLLPTFYRAPVRRVHEAVRNCRRDRGGPDGLLVRKTGTL